MDDSLCLRTVGVDISPQKVFNLHMATDMHWLCGPINPWDADIEARTEGSGYCPSCDLTFVGLDVIWHADCMFGVAECPECEGDITVYAPEGA